MSSKTTTEASADRYKKARVWAVKTLLETELGFCKGMFATEKQDCFCAYGLLAYVASKGELVSPSRASLCLNAEAKILEDFLEATKYYSVSETDEVIPVNDSDEVTCHKDTAKALQAKWGITDEEIASFTL